MDTTTAAIPVAATAPVLSPLDQIRQRRSWITSGGWQWILKHGHPVMLVAEHGTYEERILEVFDEGELLIQDADFIASAPRDIDTLLGLLEESEAINRALEATLKTLEESYLALRGDYERLLEQRECFDRYRVGVPA